MGVPWAAILAVALGGGRLDEPRYVRFQTAGGEVVAGELTAWDAEGCDGSFGRRAWREMAAADAWRVYLAVMDRADAAQWIDLGRALLEAPRGESWAERAFRKAIELDGSAAGRVEETRKAAADAIRAREQAQRDAEAQRLRTMTPEAVEWPATRWPVQSPAER